MISAKASHFFSNGFNPNPEIDFVFSFLKNCFKFFLMIFFLHEPLLAFIEFVMILLLCFMFLVFGHKARETLVV